MPLPTEARYEDDRPSEQPVSGTRAQPSPDPDEEAARLMMKVLERAKVAKSFATLAAGLLTVTAARATVQLRAVADAKMKGPAFKIVRAAAEAAAHVATHRAPPAPPETSEAPQT